MNQITEKEEDFRKISDGQSICRDDAIFLCKLYCNEIYKNNDSIQGMINFFKTYFGLTPEELEIKHKIDK